MNASPFLNSKTAQILLPTIGIGIILLMWLTDDIKANQLLFEVPRRWEIPAFETHYLYLYLHLFAFIPVFALSFDRKVAFYTSWRRLFPALFIVAIVFWVWDIWKTEAGVWGFNDRYFTFKILSLPIEEWLFFFTFPWAAVFIYACLNAYFPKNSFFRRIEYSLSIGLVFFFFLIAVFNFGKAYSFSTFMAAGLVLLWHVLFSENVLLRAHFYRAFLVGLIPFVIVNSVLTGIATQQPVVVYNPDEYLGIRFFTIPLDDFAYNFALLLGVIILFEREKQ